MYYGIDLRKRSTHFVTYYETATYILSLINTYRIHVEYRKLTYK